MLFSLRAEFLEKNISMISYITQIWTHNRNSKAVDRAKVCVFAYIFKELVERRGRLQIA